MKVRLRFSLETSESEAGERYLFFHSFVIYVFSLVSCCAKKVFYKCEPLKSAFIFK